MNSKQSIKKFNEGNCIALSMYLKNYLKKKGIKSYLIPATIPYYIQHPDLLSISHVALAVPKNKSITYILDCAFYFIKPLVIYHNKKNNKKLQIMNFTDEDLENIGSYNEITKKKHTYNQYQSIPKNTHLCKCYNINKTKIQWDYILREIINPDKSIMLSSTS